MTLILTSFKTYLLLLLLLVCSFADVQAGAHTWTGLAGNNDWNDSGNWDAGGVPVTGGDVFLVDNNTNIVFTGNITINKISVLFGSSLTIAAGAEMHLRGPGNNSQVSSSSSSLIVDGLFTSDKNQIGFANAGLLHVRPGGEVWFRSNINIALSNFGTVRNEGTLRLETTVFNSSALDNRGGTFESYVASARLYCHGRLEVRKSNGGTYRLGGEIILEKLDGLPSRMIIFSSNAADNTILFESTTVIKSDITGSALTEFGRLNIAEDFADFQGGGDIEARARYTPPAGVFDHPIFTTNLGFTSTPTFSLFELLLPGAVSNWQAIVDPAALIARHSLALPVSWRSFEANVAGKNIALNWSTTNEQDNVGFSIQRKGPGQDWEAIGWVVASSDGATISEYSFVDEAPLTGESFYRLEQFDLDDTKHYSEILSVSMRNAIETAPFPNPTSGRVKLPYVLSSCTIFNLDGQLVLKTANTSSVDLSSLPNGTYILVGFSNGDSVRYRLLKQ